MKRGLDIPTEVGNLLSAAERHNAATIVFDQEDRLIICNERYRHMYNHFDYTPNQTYESIGIQTIRRGLLDDPEVKADPEKWLRGAVNFRRSHKQSQYLVHHSSGKTLLAHHQIIEGFGCIAMRFDVTDRLKIKKGPANFSLTGFDIFSGKWSFSPLIRNCEAPTAIVSRTCSLINANDLFMDILERKDGIGINRNRVFCESYSENNLLQKAVEEKSFQGASGNKLIRVLRKSSQGYYIISVFPMSPDASEYHPSMHGVSLVSVLDPELSAPINIRHLKKLFGLTVAEAKVAVLVGEGKDLYEVSSKNGTGIGTIRNQLKSVFLKMGVNRQSELVRIIHQIGQIQAASNFS